MAELRLELSNLLASLDKRTDLIAQDLMALRREQNERFNHMEQQTTERFDRMEQQTAERFDRVGQQMTELRQDVRHLQTAVQRQMWALIAVVVDTAIKVLFFP